MLKRDLQNLDLTKTEAAVYATALELGESSMHRIAKKAQLERTTAYSAADKLKEKGLLSVTLSGKKRLYRAEHPQKIKELLQQKVTLAEALLPELLATAHAIDKKPRMRYLEGKDVLFSIYEETLEYPQQRVRVWISEPLTQRYKESDAKIFWDDYTVKRVKKKIPLSMIVPNKKIAKAKKAKDKDVLRTTKINPHNNAAMQSDIILYGGSHIAFHTYTEMVAVLIDSKAIYDTIAAIFDAYYAMLED